MAYPIKCKNPRCGKTGKYRMNNTNGWYWMRCDWCGFHTSSYKKREWALEACEQGEHYLGFGNKIMKGRLGEGEEDYL